MSWNRRDPDYCMSTYIELWHVKLTLCKCFTNILSWITNKPLGFPSGPLESTALVLLGWEQLARRPDILECVSTLHGSHCGLTPWRRTGLYGVMATTFWFYPGSGGASTPETCR
ncbi:hypothetical protein BJV78DRAFT_915860 [Lactifluus subvellereus]|nr:hypothetical protein BJV78DRAFT_915860 [Lactifluus subvellereus]